MCDMVPRVQVVYNALHDGTVRCLSALDGTPLWTFHSRAAIVVPAVPTPGGDVLVCSTDASAYVVHGGNGSVRVEVATGWQVSQWGTQDTAPDAPPSVQTQSMHAQTDIKCTTNVSCSVVVLCLCSRTP